MMHNICAAENFNDIFFYVDVTIIRKFVLKMKEKKKVIIIILKWHV